MNNNKDIRLLEIFFRCLHGEAISVRQLAEEYGMSTKSISRTIQELNAFLSEHQDLIGCNELTYSYQDKCYRLPTEEYLSGEELFALTEVLIGARAFSKEELLTVIHKLKRFTMGKDRAKLEELIGKEIYHYNEVKHDCPSVTEMLWKLAGCIREKREITISYYRMDRKFVEHRIAPASVMFTDYYFYLIAFKTDDPERKPVYFRIDRIKDIVVHRVSEQTDYPKFDEGLLRQRSLLMWPGKLRTIRFSFSGPSVQAVLDKLPTARILDRENDGYLIEAQVYGDGIKMWLLSQGAWVKVLAPDDFVEEMREEIEKMASFYQ